MKVEFAGRVYEVKEIGFYYNILVGQDDGEFLVLTKREFEENTNEVIFESDRSKGAVAGAYQTPKTASN